MNIITFTKEALEALHDFIDLRNIVFGKIGAVDAKAAVKFLVATSVDTIDYTYIVDTAAECGFVVECSDKAFHDMWYRMI
jgi:hypothetical protein